MTTKETNAAAPTEINGGGSSHEPHGDFDRPDELSPLVSFTRGVSGTSANHSSIHGGGAEERAPTAGAAMTTPISRRKVFRETSHGSSSYGHGPSQRRFILEGSIPSFATTEDGNDGIDEARAVLLGGRFLGSFMDLFGHTGSIPQSLLIGSVISVTCGVAAYLYYTVLFASLDGVWHGLPKKFIVGVWPEWAYVLWIPIVVLVMALGVGLSVKHIGEPGDLAFTINCVHDRAYIELDHVVPMVLASQFSIVGGGSLGPEAPLVAICAALAGFVSRNIFKQHQRNVIRKHTLMGMAGALAAFFGAPLGGSIFALEVCSKFGVEYFEHLIEAIFVGIMTLGVFRSLARLPMESLWTITEDKLENAQVTDLLIGAVIGLLAGLTGIAFTHCHWQLISLLDRFDLLENAVAVKRALIGASVIALVGVFIPHTLFWGEAEIQQIATAAPASDLPHVFPTRGVTGFEMDSAWHAFAVGVAKLITVSFTVAGGYRGGFIFPLFAAGTAFGRALLYVFPSVHPSIACLSFAGGLNVAITKTSLATPLILTFLSGDEYVLPAVLTASLVSLFVTSYTPFIKTQIAREDIEQSLVPRYPDFVEDDEASIFSSIRHIHAHTPGAIRHTPSRHLTDSLQRDSILSRTSVASPDIDVVFIDGPDASTTETPTRARTSDLPEDDMSLQRVTQRSFLG